MMRRFCVIISVALLTLSTGCRTVYVQGRMPILERPERPKLENVDGAEMKKMSAAARHAVTSNFNSLLDYVRKLEIAVDEYNKYAVEKNETFTDQGND